jgi:single-strand DNA-binding protein
MAKGTVNKVILIGRLGDDPDVRYLPSGAGVANLSLATNEKYKDEERTDWHKVVAFGNTAEFLKNYAGKGDRIYVEGRIQYESWEDQEGNKRYGTKIIANQVQLLGSGGNGNPQGADENAAAGDDDSVPF